MIDPRDVALSETFLKLSQISLAEDAYTMLSEISRDRELNSHDVTMSSTEISGCIDSFCEEALLCGDSESVIAKVEGGRQVDSLRVDTTLEGNLLDSVIATLIDKDKVLANARAFLEENRGVESCQRLLNMWECLTPSTQNVLSLAAEVRTLQTDKEHLRINLHRAEEEVKLLFEENNILDEENKKLLRQCNRERNRPGSGGKHTGSASAKGNKRKSSPKLSSPIDFNILDSPRQPLSPLQLNSPESRMHKRALIGKRGFLLSSTEKGLLQVVLNDKLDQSSGEWTALRSSFTLRLRIKNTCDSLLWKFSGFGNAIGSQVQISSKIPRLQSSESHQDCEIKDRLFQQLREGSSSSPSSSFKICCS
ncbi:hypothetical protein HHK36_014670 [Tetracentron sinense]|uniref:Uncharacterized protein n=1 Tax=Tetracentron sinense TaxID=13715 RepID=A0A834Z1P4_TETSI|nr:hypothetical protein HHK36_014670 [Tetracentron sinense]